MGIPDEVLALLDVEFAALLAHLDERQRRLYLASEARALGRGGTSKWNKVEHRLFSRITHSLRGQPLTSYEVLLQSISATRTKTGLSVDAMLDEND